MAIAGQHQFRVTGRKMRITMKALWQREQGQDLVEYALVGALVTLASVAALNNVAGLLTNAFTNAVANMSSTTT
jgi:pilus assembly protein Flp/PilA